MVRGWLTFALLETLVAGQIYFAHSDRFLTVAEMTERGIPRGLPLVWHFGIWSDFIFISGAAGIIVARFARQWDARSVLSAGALSLAATAVLAWLFSLSPTPGAHFHDGHVTAAGLIHLAYTLVALWVFSLLFLFTPYVPKAFLVAAGLLVVVHVFFGTHMALGIINLIESLEWFPDQPLKSLSGWIIIAALSVGLLLRVTIFDHTKTASNPFVRTIRTSIERQSNHGFDARALVYLAARRGLRSHKAQFSRTEFEVQEAALRGAIAEVEASFPDRNRFIDWILGLSGNNIATVEGRLRTFDYLCNVLTVGVLVKIFRYNLRIGDYFPNGYWDVQNYLRFLSDHGLTTALLGAVIGVYYLSRRCVKTELALLRELFSASRLPQRWTRVVGSREIAKLILVYMVTYLLIAWFIDDVRVVSFAFIVIFCINYRNMKLSRATLRQYLDEQALTPAAEDEHREFILLRREVAEDYVFTKPHLVKETACAVACAVTLVMGVVGYALASQALIRMATVTIIGTLMVNEATVFWWRMLRGRKLRIIDEDQAISDRQRTGGI